MAYVVNVAYHVQLQTSHGASDLQDLLTLSSPYLGGKVYGPSLRLLPV